MKRYCLIPSLLASAVALHLIGATLPVTAQQFSRSEAAQHALESPELEAQTAQTAKDGPTAALSSVSYECVSQANQLSTIANTSRGRIELVKWQSSFFGTYWTPERRCEEVTKRLQRFSDTRQLRYISWGRLNNYKILCISGNEGACMQDGLLLTLEPDDNPVRVLRNLFDYKVPITRGSKTVIDLEELLQTREPLGEGEASPPEPEVTTPQSSLDSTLSGNTLEVAPVFR